MRAAAPVTGDGSVLNDEGQTGAGRGSIKRTTPPSRTGRARALEFTDHAGSRQVRHDLDARLSWCSRLRRDRGRRAVARAVAQTTCGRAQGGPLQILASSVSRSKTFAPIPQSCNNVVLPVGDRPDRLGQEEVRRDCVARRSRTTPQTGGRERPARRLGLAETLGISPSTALKHVARAGADWLRDASLLPTSTSSQGLSWNS